MLQIKKNRSILAAFFFCAQVFIACTESNPPFPAEAIAESKPIQEEATKPDSTQKETAAPDSTTKKTTTSDSTLKETVKSNSTTEGSTKRFSGFDEENVLHTYISGDESGKLYSGNLYLDFPADSFLTKFELGDIVTVAINGYDTLELPVAEASGDVPIAWFMLSAISGSDKLLLTMHNGQLAEVLGITDVKKPIEVIVSMKEKSGFKFGLEMRNVQYLDVYVENYPTLSIEEFANFREVRTTGMGKNKLYRSSSPIDPCLGRNLKADSLAKEAGIATFINLADAEEYAIAFNGFDSSYYASQNALFLALPVEFFSKPFEEGLAKGFRYMIEHEGPYLIHCTYGMDRTGFTIAILEALMGATTEEIQADYAKTFSNYYNVVDGKQIALNEQQVDFFKAVVLRNLKAVYRAEGVNIPDTDNIDWATATAKYLEKFGLTPEEISALKEKLK
jgi:protein tyrosine/serine phosphatase